MNRIYQASYSGQEYVGNVMMDEFWFAGRLFPKFTFVEMVEGYGTGDIREGYDGIIGMRRPPENEESCEVFKTTILDHVVDAGIVKDAAFTFRFCGRHGVRGDSWFIHGNLEFGGIRLDYFHPPIVSLPIYQATQWVVDITSVQYGDVVLCNPCRAHVDTGSPDTFAPAEVLDTLLKHSVVEKHANGVLYVHPHSLYLVQPLKLKMDSHVFTLWPQELTRFTAGFYQFAIQVDSDDSETTWTLGISLLRHLYVLFNQTSNQMGFAAVKC
ncbi:hypothetical protein CRM22_010906 [Opisthorchis felineus]|uniref:Peptidase A1 domain-containing protein n=1 Tax=Opisthorchis felineus TaxID=147828 RepID=A0A4S2KNF9_OPIFE|nr:hypothetical protein CRM22_010906 [Opisthorchis felineus]